MHTKMLVHINTDLHKETDMVTQGDRLLKFLSNNLQWCQNPSVLLSSAVYEHAMNFGKSNMNASKTLLFESTGGCQFLTEMDWT